MIAVAIAADLKPLHRAMIALSAKQIPFATSLALNDLAYGFKAETPALVADTFDTPTPFTQNAFRVIPSTKARPIAVVAAKDIQAEYLEPYVHGGSRSLGTKRGMLAPRGTRLNQYGNLPKSTMQRLKGKPNVFVGPVTFRKTGKTISGVWERGQTKRGERYKGGGDYGTRGKHNVVGGARTTLKLLIQFEDTTPVRKHLPFEERARAYVKANAADAFSRALIRAVATARR